MEWLIGLALPFIIFGISNITSENKRLRLQKTELENSIKSIENIINLQKNTPQNSENGTLDVDIYAPNVELNEPSSRQEFVKKAVGTLHLHHDEFVFLSTTQTRNIKLSNIIKTDLFLDGLRFYLKNRQKTITFTNLNAPTAYFHLLNLFNIMNQKYSTYRWEDPEFFISELTSIVDKLKTKLDKL